MTNWRDDKPTGTDFLSELPSLFTQNKIAFREALERHFYWTEASGASAGIPRLSAGPGSARAFFGLQSQVSGTNCDVRLMLTSDTSRLYVVGSGTSVCVGSTNVIATGLPSTATITAGTRVLIQSSYVTNCTAAAVQTVIFPTPYGAPPFIFLQAAYSVGSHPFTTTLRGITSSTFSFGVVENGIGAASACTVYWRSEGTITI